MGCSVSGFQFPLFHLCFPFISCIWSRRVPWPYFRSCLCGFNFLCSVFFPAMAILPWWTAQPSSTRVTRLCQTRTLCQTASTGMQGQSWGRSCLNWRVSSLFSSCNPIIHIHTLLFQHYLLLDVGILDGRTVWDSFSCVLCLCLM